MSPPPLPKPDFGQRPAAVRVSVLLGWSALLFGPIRLLLSPPWYQLRMPALTAVVGPRFLPLVWIGAALLILPAKGALLYAAGRGLNWARITLLILFVTGLPSVVIHLQRSISLPHHFGELAISLVLGLPFAITYLLRPFSMAPILVGLTVVQTLCRLSCVGLLFSNEASLWFRSRSPISANIPG